MRADDEDLEAIERSLERRENLSPAAEPARAVDLDLEFYTAVVDASKNPMFRQLNASIRESFRVALSFTVRLRASTQLEIAEHRRLFDAIRSRDPLAARARSEEIVGFAMLAVEQVIRSRNRQ